MKRGDHVLHVRYYVVRVLLHPGAHPRKVPVRFSDMDPITKVSVLAMVQAGDLVTLPDGCIAEGVREHTNEVDAHGDREVHAREYPDEDFRVVLTSAEPLL